ncbi:platelet-activating factor acetylhydrolase [Massariosphaeria phaeospora]|uniref:Putative phospholipase n=1 Tax=Massariosphaeria phaeospora TaxID=100035 RepID=A0A7C8MJT2_9PLEO|nr:platelet-activating factor acetylhydrolase [Massariosphaeria phaeospora]
MTWLERLNPTPTFPAYTGPYKVGSVDAEIPTADLESPSPPSSSCADLTTVAFRVYYPCKPDSQQRGVRWIPSPQREYIGAYARFLGANSAFSQLFSVVPQLLNFVSIPVHHTAEILEPPTKTKRWPVMMFSHGLGGSRNAYSHICGSLASHGIVVVAPEHRDGSTPISFINSPEEKGKLRHVEYRKVPHKASTEVYETRDDQLRIRLWELGAIHDALLKIDERAHFRNVAEGYKRTEGKDALNMFAHMLNVHEPGAISFAGHSFGAASMIQFVKSVFYRPSSETGDYKPLFTPSESSSIVRQITPSTPVILLDLWTLPIQSSATAWLRSKPMPCYASPNGGSNLLAILSEAFYKWSSNLNDCKKIVAKPTGAECKYPEQPGPHIFYPIASAHLSQSDFGVLFPWVTTKVFGAKEPERVLKLNVRAILQVLRNGGVEVANTGVQDLEIEDVDVAKASSSQDKEILDGSKDSVRGWVSLSMELDQVNGYHKTAEGPGDAMVEGEALGKVMSGDERSQV